ncbi:MAG: hypothetical protein Q8Q33_05020 [Chlamydiota bacterium]|nr:hypothetical protein [Chlamydiota bacterium]
MKYLVLVGVLLLSPVFSHAGDNWLLGKWQTDKIKTLTYLKTDQKADQDQLTYLEERLTPMMMEFKEGSIIVEFENQQYVHQYTIIEQSETVIKLDVAGDDDPKKTFIKDERSMYLITPFDVMDREYFRRID